MITDSERMAEDYAEGSDRTRRASATASKMSASQRELYWSLWFRLCRLKGWDSRDKELRHRFMADTLEASGGEARTFHDFDQPDFGVVKFTLIELISGRTPTPAQLKQIREDETRRNLLWVIDGLIHKYGRPSSLTLLRERFHIVLGEQLRAAPLDTLEQVRQTLVARTYQRRG